jgi:hypothetical protein
VLHVQENVYATAARPAPWTRPWRILSMTSTCACRWPKCC